MALLATLSLALLFCLGSCSSKFYSNNDYEDAKALMNILSKPRGLDRDSKLHAKEFEKYGVKKVEGFSWGNCGSASDPIVISSLSLQPDPLHIPGDITLSFNATLRTAVQAPIKIELTLKKKIVFWIEIPCVDNLGSCTYDDLCSMLPFKPGQCPPPFVKAGLPCTCPVKAGAYSLPSATFNVNIPSIPSWLDSGDYQARATLSMAGQHLGCYHLQLSLK